jgi:hypothetical protein
MGKKQNSPDIKSRLLKVINPGNVPICRSPAAQVLPPLRSLTAVFGMGTGVASSPWSPELKLGASQGALHGLACHCIALRSEFDLLAMHSYAKQSHSHATLCCMFVVKISAERSVKS